MALVDSQGPIRREKVHSNLTRKVKYKELLLITADWNKRLANEKVKSSQEDKKSDRRSQPLECPRKRLLYPHLRVKIQTLLEREEL